MTTFTNTGSWRMTAAFYNEMRKMEVEDVRDDDTMRLVSMVEAAAETAPLPTASPRSAASVPDHDDRSVALLERSVLARVMWDQRGMET